MRILLANSTAYPKFGGVENSLRFIGRELLRSGHEVKILCFQTTLNEPLRMEHEGIEIVRLPSRQERWPHIRLQMQLRNVQENISSFLRQYRPDAVWCRSAAVGLGIRRGGYRGPLLQIFCTNAAMNCRGQYLHNSGLSITRKMALAGLYPFAYLTSSRIERELMAQCIPVVFSENLHRQMVKAHPLAETAFHVIPPGVDDELYSPENGARYFEAIERKYGMRRSESTVLYTGRLSPAKNIPMLMDAVLRLKQCDRLVLVGNGPEEYRLRAYANRTGISDRTVFAGSHNELLPGFYAISSVFVLPTTVESFGQVFLESLAAGTPAVGFAEQGNRVMTATSEIIRDGITGGVVGRVDARSLAEKIDAILSLDRQRYQEMSRRARNDVRVRFSWERFVSNVLELSF